MVFFFNNKCFLKLIYIHFAEYRVLHANSFFDHYYSSCVWPSLAVTDYSFFYKLHKNRHWTFTNLWINKLFYVSVHILLLKERNISFFRFFFCFGKYLFTFNVQVNLRSHSSSIFQHTCHKFLSLCLQNKVWVNVHHSRANWPCVDLDIIWIRNDERRKLESLDYFLITCKLVTSFFSILRLV